MKSRDAEIIRRIVRQLCILSGSVTFRASAPQAAEQTSASQPASAPIEQGKFILHKFEQPIGEETYQIVRDGDSLAVKMEFKFTDRGTPVPLSSTFRGRVT